MYKPRHGVGNMEPNGPQILQGQNVHQVVGKPSVTPQTQQAVQSNTSLPNAVPSGYQYTPTSNTVASSGPNSSAEMANVKAINQANCVVQDVDNSNKVLLWVQNPGYKNNNPNVNLVPGNKQKDQVQNIQSPGQGMSNASSTSVATITTQKTFKNLNLANHPAKAQMKIPEPTHINLSSRAIEKVGSLKIHVSESFLPWNITNKTVLDLEFMRHLFNISGIDVILTDAKQNEKAIRAAVEQLFYNKVLPDWLVLKCEEKEIPFLRVNSQVEIYTVNNFAALLNVITQETCLPLPFITEDKNYLQYLYLNFPKTGNDKVKKLNTPVFHVADNGKKRLLCKYPGIRLDCDFGSRVESFIIHVHQSALLAYETSVSKIRQYIIYMHIIWGFLQMWIRRVMEKYNQCFKFEDIAKNLSLCKSEDGKISGKDNELIYDIGYLNCYLKFDPVILKETKATFSLENFSTNTVCNLAIVQFYKQFFLINDMHFSDALKNTILFFRDHYDKNVVKASGYVGVPPSLKSLRLIPRGNYSSPEQQVACMNNTNKNVVNANLSANTSGSAVSQGTRVGSMNVVQVEPDKTSAIPVSEKPRLKARTVEEINSSVDLVNRTNVNNSVVASDRLKALTVEEINSSVELAKRTGLNDSTVASAVGQTPDPKRREKARRLNYESFVSLIQRFLENCYASNNIELCTTDESNEEAIIKRRFDEAVRRAIGMETIELFIEKIYVYLQIYYTNSTSQSILNKMIWRAIEAKYPHLKEHVSKNIAESLKDISCGGDPRASNTSSSVLELSVPDPRASSNTSSSVLELSVPDPRASSNTSSSVLELSARDPRLRNTSSSVLELSSRDPRLRNMSSSVLKSSDRDPRCNKTSSVLKPSDRDPRCNKTSSVLKPSDRDPRCHNMSSVLKSSGRDPRCHNMSSVLKSSGRDPRCHNMSSVLKSSGQDPRCINTSSSVLKSSDRDTRVSNTSSSVLESSNGDTQVSNTSSSVLESSNGDTRCNKTSSVLKSSDRDPRCNKTTAVLKSTGQDPRCINTSSSVLKSSDRDTRVSNTSSSVLESSNGDTQVNNTSSSVLESSNGDTRCNKTSSVLKSSDRDPRCNKTTAVLKSSGQDPRCINTSSSVLKSSDRDTRVSNTSSSVLESSGGDTQVNNTSSSVLESSNGDTQCNKTSSVLKSSGRDPRCINTSSSVLKSSDRDTRVSNTSSSVLESSGGDIQVNNTSSSVLESSNGDTRCNKTSSVLKSSGRDPRCINTSSSVLKSSGGDTQVNNTSSSVLESSNGDPRCNKTTSVLKSSGRDPRCINTSSSVLKSSDRDTRVSNTLSSVLESSGGDTRVSNTSSSVLESSNGDTRCNKTSSVLKSSDRDPRCNKTTSVLKSFGRDPRCINTSSSVLKSSDRDTRVSNTSSSVLESSGGDTRVNNTSSSVLESSGGDTRVNNKSSSVLESSNGDTRVNNTSSSVLESSNGDTRVSNMSSSVLESSGGDTRVSNMSSSVLESDGRSNETVIVNNQNGNQSCIPILTAAQQPDITSPDSEVGICSEENDQATSAISKDQDVDLVRAYSSCEGTEKINEQESPIPSTTEEPKDRNACSSPSHVCERSAKKPKKHSKQRRSKELEKECLPYRNTLTFVRVSTSPATFRISSRSEINSKTQSTVVENESSSASEETSIQAPNEIMETDHPSEEQEQSAQTVEEVEEVYEECPRQNDYSKYNLKPCSVVLNSNEVKMYMKKYRKKKRREISLEESDVEQDEDYVPVRVRRRLHTEDSDDNDFITERKRIRRAVSEIQYMEARTRVLQRLRKRKSLYAGYESTRISGEELDSFLVRQGSLSKLNHHENNREESEGEYKIGEGEDSEAKESQRHETHTKKGPSMKEVRVALVRLEDTPEYEEHRERLVPKENWNPSMNFLNEKKYSHINKNYFEIREGKLYLKEGYCVKDGKIVRTDEVSPTGPKREPESPERETDFDLLIKRESSID